MEVLKTTITVDSMLCNLLPVNLCTKLTVGFLNIDSKQNVNEYR